MKKILECSELAASYDGRKVISGLNFTINEGDYVCILGENGSGKSTLIKCLLGIKAPESGKIIMGDGLKQRDIGYLPQHTDLAKGFPATVTEVVLSGCLGRRGLRPFYSSKEKELAKQAMARLGISDLAGRSCRELSGGQQQRMLLARAMCAAKKLLLLDEPVTGLDPAAAADMYDLIDELNKKDGMTIIMVSHDVVKSLDSASRILCLCSSDHSFYGTPEEYANSHISSKFIGD
ncbi:MAG: ABC transporter ATP-binding protein [Ruminococcus sp.]|nr:ABC transporter ATP-binding protein [Ruminococcus sp.]HRR77265.1 ABC transporter ATP-binding protein [Ruminococcus sp.]